MSSVRGQSSREWGRGSPPTGPSRGRGASTSRGRGFSGNPPRGSTATRSASGRPPRGNPTRGARGSSSAVNNATTRRPSPQQGAFDAAKTRGSWQERFQALTKARERERADAIRHGLIADPDKPRSLSEAITPVGTCQDMCAEYERVQRVVQKDVWDEETDPNHSAFATTDDEPDEARMVKKFRRAAAGLEEQLPSDLRPPAVLKRTCDYLFNDVVGNAPSLAHIHHFVWDRTRAIRNDFSIQQLTRPDELRIAIECYERIARFHIVSLHQLALPEKPYSKYDWQQEREQLDRTLLSLMQYYDDSHGRIEVPNEAEFRAYCVIFQLQDPIPDLEDRVQTWPRQIVQDTRTRKALDVYMAACNVLDAQGPLKPRASHLIARQDWQRFWTLVASKEVSYLMACVAEIYFNLVRRTVLNALFRTTRASSSLATPDWTIDLLCELLAFDDGDEVYTYCEKFGFNFKEREDGQQYLDLTSVKGRTLPEPAAGIPKQSKTSLVEDKRFGRTIPAIINGLDVRQAQETGMVINEDGEMEDVMENDNLLGESMLRTGRENEPIDDGESLFLPETQPSMPATQSSAPLTNGLNGTSNTSQSVFSGFGNTSSFGRPSNTGGTPSIFTPASNPAAQVPPPSTLGGGMKFDFKQPTSATASGPPTTIPTFNFTADNGSGSTVTREEDKSQPVFSFTQPPKDSSGIFANAPSSTSVAAPSLFQPFNSSTPTTTTAQQDKMPAAPQAPPKFAFSAPGSNTPAEAPKGSFTFGPAAGTPVTPAPNFPSQSAEARVSQPPSHFSTSPASPTSFSNQHGSTPGLNSPIRKTSFSANKPAKPSPLSNSITAGDEPDNVVPSQQLIGTSEVQTVNDHFPGNRNQVSRTSSAESKAVTGTASEEPEEDLKSIVARVADEFFYAPVGGVLDQYIAHHVQQTIKQVQRKLELERLTAHANRERQLALCHKYGKKWRTIFLRHRLAKSGRERRERRQRRLHERSSQEVEGGSLFGTESIRSSSRAESTTAGANETLKIDGTMGPSWSNPTPTELPVQVGSKRPMSSHGIDTVVRSRENGHKRLKSTSHVDERGRVTKPTVTSHPHADILKRSSFLGFSPSINAPSNNTTTSSYFRLKAMGVNQIDNSIGPRGMKRRLSTSVQSSAQTSPPARRSPSILGSSLGHSVDKALMPPPASGPSRAQKSNEEDEALFARLKAARENLEKGTSYFKSEVSKDDEFQRSMNASQSSNESESPSMAKARADARLRASHSAFGDGASSSGREVPAYRLRESKFVPREQYGKAIERAKEFRESRSRETSRPESRVSHRESEPETQVTKPASTQGQTQTGVQTQNSSHKMKKPNGISHTTAAPSQSSTFAKALNSFTPLDTQPPISFSNHTTQMSGENPFLNTNVSNSFDHANAFDNFVPPSAFSIKGGDKGLAEPIDQTIQPSLINQALSNSWGSSHGHGQNHLMSLPNNGPMPYQQDSYLPSQPISLLSDDEDVEQEFSAVQSRIYGATETENANGELLDESTEDEGFRYSYRHRNPYVGLARDPDVEDEEQEFESGIDEDEERYDGGYGEDLNGYPDDFEDEEGVDGDIDEDESQIDDEAGGAFGYDDAEDEGETHKNPRLRQLTRDQRFPPPPPNPAMQAVGNSVEEAIELSD